MNEVSGVSDATAINLSSEKDDWNEWKRDEKSESWTGVSLPFPHFFLAIPDLTICCRVVHLDELSRPLIKNITY